MRMMIPGSVIALLFGMMGMTVCAQKSAEPARRDSIMPQRFQEAVQRRAKCDQLRNEKVCGSLTIGNVSVARQDGTGQRLVIDSVGTWNKRGFEGMYEIYSEPFTVRPDDIRLSFDYHLALSIRFSQDDFDFLTQSIPEFRSQITYAAYVVRFNLIDAESGESITTIASLNNVSVTGEQSIGFDTTVTDSPVYSLPGLVGRRVRLWATAVITPERYLASQVGYVSSVLANGERAQYIELRSNCGSEEPPHIVPQLRDDCLQSNDSSQIQ